MTTVGVAAVHGAKRMAADSMSRSVLRPEPKWETTFRHIVANRGQHSVHVVGVGNPTRGDDGVGIFVVNSLKRAMTKKSSAILKVHPPALEPERIISRLGTKGEPIVIVDAVQTGADPGTVICAPVADTKFGYFATHNIPLKLIPGVYESLGTAFVLGIEPESIGFGEGLTDTVDASAKMLVGRIVSILEGEQIGES